MKIALVGPSLKKGVECHPNYRPVSILSNFFNTLEKFMYNRLISFVVNKRNILSEAHNGFRKMKSTTRDCQTFMEIIQEAIDLRLLIVGIFLHLAKSNDVLNQKTFLKN